MSTFDAFIIGTGTAGQTAAAHLRDAGLSVGIADERPFGGTCALRGCQPKKYLVVPAHAALEGAGLTERGFQHAPELNWSAMQRSRAEFTDAVPESTEDGLSESGVKTFHGHCVITGPQTVLCGEEEVHAGTILVATGARPRPLEIPGGELAMTSDDFLYLPELPQRITFVGGGYISLEFATVASALGRSVTIVHSRERLMERFCPEMIPDLRKSCTEQRIELRTGVRPQSIEKSGAEYHVGLTDGTTIETDVVFAAVGRLPNTAEMGLEAVGVEHSRRGISVNGRMQTSVPSIYAIGDCVDTVQLAPVSDYEAHTAAANIVAGGRGPEIDYSTVPTVVFTYPQLAQIGVTDAAEDPDISVISGSGAAWPNYRRLNEPHMRYRVLKRKSTDTIIGASILAPHAGELINAFAMIIQSGMTAAQVRGFPWAYPTYLSDIKYMVG